VKYARFEALMISLGALVIFGSLLMGPPLNQLGFWQEGLGQVLIIVVLAAAVHWGRDGGSVTAFAATLVYVLTRIPLLSQQGLTKNILAMIVTRVLIYAIVGILGGEIFGRVKYIVAQLEGSSTLDDFTQVYNRRYCGQALKNGLGQFQRYQVPFSIAVISLAPGLFTDLRPSRQRTFLRNVANHVRNDIRLVDDVGYLGDGRFIVILPQTPGSGAAVASDRIRSGVRDLVGAKDESVTATPLAVPEDAAAMCDLARSLDPEADIRIDDPCAPEETATA
jgi:GGDEF domain-containing protein